MFAGWFELPQALHMYHMFFILSDRAEWFYFLVLALFVDFGYIGLDFKPNYKPLNIYCLQPLRSFLDPTITFLNWQLIVDLL